MKKTIILFGIIAVMLVAVVYAGTKEVIVQRGYYYLTEVDWTTPSYAYDNDWNTYGQPVDCCNWQRLWAFYSNPDTILNGSHWYFEIGEPRQNYTVYLLPECLNPPAHPSQTKLQFQRPKEDGVPVNKIQYGCGQAGTIGGDERWGSNYILQGTTPVEYGAKIWDEEMHFIVSCTPHWDCIEYAECNLEGERECIAVNDTNGCMNETYTGDYTEFEQICYASPVEEAVKNAVEGVFRPYSDTLITDGVGGKSLTINTGTITPYACTNIAGEPNQNCVDFVDGQQTQWYVSSATDFFRDQTEGCFEALGNFTYNQDSNTIFQFRESYSNRYTVIVHNYEPDGYQLATHTYVNGEPAYWQYTDLLGYRQDGALHQYMICGDGTKQYFYVDGLLNATWTDDFWYNDIPSGYYMAIGTHLDSAYYSWKGGTFARLAFYNKNFSQEEITWLYNDGDFQCVANCTVCEENWLPEYSPCNVSDAQVLTYYDNNSCGYYDELPLNNGTVEECNYCTIGYEENSTDCSEGQAQAEHTFSYTNYETCCALTSIPADCDLPANYTTSCIGMHMSSDIPAVVIDNIVAVGSEYVKYAPLIAIITILIFIGIKKWVK